MSTINTRRENGTHRASDNDLATTQVYSNARILLESLTTTILSLVYMCVLMTVVFPAFCISLSLSFVVGVGGVDSVPFVVDVLRVSLVRRSLASSLILTR